MARLGMNLSKFQRSQKLVVIYSPRTALKTILQNDDRLLSDITLNFDKFTINLMKNEFRLRNWEIRLADFIGIVKEHLTNWQVDLPNRSYRLVRCLTNLFEEIDINGNGLLEWEEFTNYIIEKATILKNLRTKNQEVKGYTKLDIRPQIKMDNSIPKTVFIPDLNKLAIFEQGSHIIHFMDPDTGQCLNKPLIITPKQLVVSMSMVKKDKDGKVEIKKKQLVVPTGIRVLDMLYINEEKYRLLVTATSDGFVRGWRYSSGVGFTLATQPDNQEEFVEHQFSQEIYCMAWDGLNEILFCSQKDGNISIWNLKTDIEKPLYDPSRRDPDEQIHTMMVMDMITVPKLHFMASGGMDGKVILWDTINNKVKWVYRQHTRGVLSVSYNQQLILLFSAGFDHKICIWNPYISTIIHKIQSHSAPVLCVRAISSTYQVVSLDSDGIVKVHDIRRFNYLSSFSANSHDDNLNLKLSPTNFAIIPKPLKLCFVGRSVSVFQYDKNYNPVCVDDIPALSCKYLPSTLRFYTPCGNKIKVWSALTGEVEYVFLEVTLGEITTFCVDEKEKCMAVGDIQGNIVLVNITNGAKLRNMPGHAGEVTQILATRQGEFNIFISVGADNVINIVRETQDGYELARSLNIRKDTSISCMAYCPLTKYIIVGTTMGVIGFYQTDTGKLIGSVNDHSLDQVSSVCRMDFDSIIATSTLGCITILTTRSKFQKLLSLSHMDPECTGSPQQLGIVTSLFKLKKLFVVDDKMFMTCYNFESFQISSLMNQMGDHSPSTVRRNGLKMENKHPNFRVDREWVVKTHNQMVRSLEWVEGENILATSGFDKRVKLWRAETGQYIDSLQQNYQRKQPQVIAYLKPLSKQLYKTNFSKSPISIANCNIQTDFDPFCCYEIEKHCDIKVTKSHPDWNLQVNFKAVYEEKEKQFKKALEDAKLTSAQIMKTNLQERLKKGILSMHNSPNRGKSLIKQLTEMNRDAKMSSSRASYFGLQGPKPKPTPSLHKQSIKTLVPTSGDFISQMRKLKTKEQVARDKENHRAYIENLHRQEIQSKLMAKNDTKIFLSKEEADAAARLGRALFSVDRTDKRALTIMNSIVVRDQKLPKL